MQDFTSNADLFIVLNFLILSSFVSSALFSSENEKSESEERFKPARFKRCFPTSVSSPDCIPALSRKIQKHVLDSVAVQLDRKEGQKNELVATGAQLKRTKSGNTLLSSSGTNKYIMFLLVIATGRRLLHCSMDNFSKVNETRIKVLSSPPRG